MGEEAPEVAAVWIFDLEHLGAEIRHHGSGGWSRDVGTAVDDPDSRQDSVLHRQTPTNEIADSSLVQWVGFGNPSDGFKANANVLRAGFCANTFEREGKKEPVFFPFGCAQSFGWW